jgi:hypothetical protein
MHGKRLTASPSPNSHRQIVHFWNGYGTELSAAVVGGGDGGDDGGTRGWWSGSFGQGGFVNI